MKVKLYDHPFAVIEPKEFEVKSVAEWLVSYYGEVPKVTLQIYKGEPSLENDISSNVEELLYGNSGTYTVLESPGGAEVTLAMFLTQVAIALAVSVVISILFPAPDMPGNVNRNQSSPNNSLASRENQVRFNQRVEDIYGKVKSIPSLMMPTYNKYIEHKQYEYGYYCIGRGYYEVTDIKDDDTLISDLSGAKASVYDPFTSPNDGQPRLQINGAITDRLFTVARASKVDGITLKALNQIQLPDTANYTFFKSSDTSANIGDVIKGATNPTISSVCSAGDIIDITMSDVNVTTYYYHPAQGDEQGYYDYNIIVSSFTYNYSGTYEIATVDGEDIILTSFTFTQSSSPIAATIKIQDLVSSVKVNRNEYTDWITLNDKDRTQVWANIIARGGMYLGRDGRKDAWGVDFSIEIEKLDPTSFTPTGIIEVVDSGLTGATTDERAITLEHITAWNGPCRVRARRTSLYDYGISGTVVDEIKWQDLYSVTPVEQLHFGNKATIHTVTKATARATSISSRKLNCIATRQIPMYTTHWSSETGPYNAFSGGFDNSGMYYGAIHGSSRLCDILGAIANDPKIGGGISNMDMDQLYSIQNELDVWHEEAGIFNYTFDTDTTSFEETISMVANAGFCLAYRQNGKIRLAFDKLQTNSSALFTHRNKKPDSETITRTFATDSEYDGVEFIYNDPESEQSETIKLPLDGTATKYKKYEIPGIRSFKQAWYRANREYQKLRGQRLSIDTTCTTDARLLLPNTRVDVVDNTRFKAYDGEVIKQSGLVLTLSREVVFTEGTHSILLMKRDGSLDSITCTAGAFSNQVILSRAPNETVVTTPGIEGIRTIFSFASDSSRASQAWLVQEVGLSDGEYISIKAINYSDSYYYYDTQPIPERDSIINS